MKKIGKLKRFMSGVIGAVMAISAMPTTLTYANESSEPFPYTMFAASSDEGAITIETGNFA